jgi:hypothetical protein
MHAAYDITRNAAGDQLSITKVNNIHLPDERT